jgi:ferric-dicitrate binding protein FerR (iron transport regulator)
MTPHTDDLLGAALRELEVPEHRPEFHRELRRRLRTERRPRLRFAAGGGALAAAVAVAALLLSLRGGGSASAATVQAHVRSALASLRTLSGTLVAAGQG